MLCMFPDTYKKHPKQIMLSVVSLSGRTTSYILCSQIPALLAGAGDITD